MKLRALLPLCVVVGMAGCGKKSSTTGTSTGDLADTFGISNKLAEAYPAGGLSLAVFSEGATTSALNATESETAEDKEDKKSFKERLDDAKERLNGKSDCVPEILKKAPRDSYTEETCYEFDQDMLYGYRGNGGVSGERRIYGTLDGKSGGEACLVSFTRSKIKQTSDQVERATGIVQAMMCQAKKLNPAVDLPATGASLDLKELLSEGVKSAGPKIEKAVIRRLDDVEGKPVYQSEVTMKEPGSKGTRTVVLTHSPGAEDSGEYSGTLLVTHQAESGASGAQGQNNNDNDKQRKLSITYARVKQSDGTYRVRQEVRAAQLHNDLAAKAFDSGILDFNVSTNADGAYLKADGTAFSQANDAASGMTYIVFEVNPDNNAGVLSYWQNPGGNYAEPARGFNFKIEPQSDGNLKGCGISGAAFGASGFSDALSIRKAIKTEKSLAPGGFWHPFFASGTWQASSSDCPTGATSCYVKSSNGPGGQTGAWAKPNLSSATLAQSFANDGQGTYVTRQCFKENATTGKYEIDTEAVTEGAGWELVSTADSTKIISTPEKVQLKIKPKHVD